MAVKQDKLLKLFNAYVAPRKILIADSSGASRAGLAKSLVGMGAKMQNITMVPDFAVAEATAKEKKPQIIVCDFDLKGGSGLNLLQTQREGVKDSKESLFVLVTGNTSQSAVAQAAEEDIDTYILKPYTVEVFRQSVMKAAIAKINPSEYVKIIDEGKKLLEDKKFDEAIQIFEKAMTLDSKPSLACFYLGQGNEGKEQADQASGSYEKGLGFNKIHYKCLVGNFELLMEKKDYIGAYEVVKKLSRYFPANPKRLATVLRLAIMTKGYEDIERYYQVFTELDQRSEEIIRYICAALVVVGKYYLQTNFRQRGLELFQKAGTTAAGKTKILREIVTALMSQDLFKDAEEYMKRFPADTHNQADFLAMRLLIDEKALTPAQVIEMGRKVMKDGVKDPTIHLVMIRTSKSAGMDDYAETLLQEATKEWPAQEAEFKSNYESTQKKSA